MGNTKGKLPHNTNMLSDDVPSNIVCRQCGVQYALNKRQEDIYGICLTCKTQRVLDILDGINLVKDFMHGYIMEAGLTQRQLAKKIYASESALSQWITGARALSPDQIISLTQHLALSQEKTEVLIESWEAQGVIKDQKELVKSAQKNGPLPQLESWLESMIDEHESNDEFSQHNEQHRCSSMLNSDV